MSDNNGFNRVHGNLLLSTDSRNFWWYLSEKISL
nr:hypothetical protein SHINE37_42941 [Rhizobiaceae bacterium]